MKCFPFSVHVHFLSFSPTPSFVVSLHLIGIWPPKHPSNAACPAWIVPDTELVLLLRLVTGLSREISTHSTIIWSPQTCLTWSKTLIYWWLLICRHTYDNVNAFHYALIVQMLQLGLRPLSSYHDFYNALRTSNFQKSRQEPSTPWLSQKQMRPTRMIDSLISPLVCCLACVQLIHCHGQALSPWIGLSDSPICDNMIFNIDDWIGKTSILLRHTANICKWKSRWTMISMT